MCPGTHCPSIAESAIVPDAEADAEADTLGDITIERERPFLANDASISLLPFSSTSLCSFLSATSCCLACGASVLLSVSVWMSESVVSNEQSMQKLTLESSFSSAPKSPTFSCFLSSSLEHTFFLVCFTSIFSSLFSSLPSSLFPSLFSPKLSFSNPFPSCPSPSALPPNRCNVSAIGSIKAELPTPPLTIDIALCRSI